MGGDAQQAGIVGVVFEKTLAPAFVADSYGFGA